MRRRKELGLQEMLGDMTSMIDVVFLLLIFFILMPFKAPEARIESHLPKTGDGPGIITQEPIEKIDLRIKLDSATPINTRSFEGVTVTINGKKVTEFVGLKGRLAELQTKLKLDPSKIPVEINADENVPFYFVMKTMDYAKINSFSYIKFPAKKPIH